MAITSIFVLRILLDYPESWNGVNILFFRKKPCILKVGEHTPFCGRNHGDVLLLWVSESPSLFPILTGKRIKVGGTPADHPHPRPPRQRQRGHFIFTVHGRRDRDKN